MDKVAERVNSKFYFISQIPLYFLTCTHQVLARKDDDAAASGYEKGGVELVLDQTAEFCRGLGEVEKRQLIQTETYLKYIKIRLVTGKICNLV